MLFNVLRFEVRYRLRQISTHLFFAILFLLAFLFVATDAVRIGGATGRIAVNSPLVLAQITTILTAFGALMACAIVGTAVYRDFETNTHELLFTTRLSKASYLIGRFVGAFLVALYVYSGILWGVALGAVMPWVDKDKVLPFAADGYLQAFFVFLVPNLLLIAALFFIVGALTRSLLTIYTTGVALLVGYIIAGTLLRDLDNRNLAALLDPFGLRAMSLATRYWTIDERNHSLIPLTGTFLGNRLLWTGVAAVVFAIGYRLFRFEKQGLSLARRRASSASEKAFAMPTSSVPSPARAAAPPAHSGGIRAVAPLTLFYLREIVRGVPFQIITLMGVVLLVLNAINADEIFDTKVWPVTRIMVEVVSGSFMLFFLILTTFYAGELTWRERVLRLSQIHDSQPVSTGATAISKIAAVLLMQALMFAALMLTGMVIQTAKGYTHYEPGLYLSYLYGISWPSLISLTLLAFFIHTLVNNKFLGHTLVILTFIASGVLPVWGLEDYLYRFAEMPSVTYSDMNRYGPYVQTAIWFPVYWLLFSGLLTVLTLQLWVRGTDAGIDKRLNRAISQWAPGRLIAAGVFGFAWLACGAFIAYNTHFLNPYRTSKYETKLRARYEKDYKAKYEKLPQPRITDAKIALDIFPERQQWELTGEYALQNRSGKPVTEVPVDLDNSLRIRSLTFDRPTEQAVTEKEMGFYVYRFKTPLKPGETAKLSFSLAKDNRGFKNGGPDTRIAQNGSFLSGIVPSLGYQAGSEISDEQERKRQKLPPRPRMAPVTDKEARRNTYIGSDADWIGFEATVSTSRDQIALAPGYLQKTWEKNGRRYFHYKMNAPIRNFYTFLSARYSMAKDTWTGRQGEKVNLEIYYHPTHTYDLDRMMRGMKKSLTYYTNNFSPFQYRQLRIVEFPAYATFAQSFPNTVPYSEGIGFIARVDDKDPESIDYPFYVTAHETAHQWWAHQVLGGNVEGSEMLSESLAEYSSLMVMEHEYGPQKMRRFLRHNLDSYLAGRAGEQQNEQPLFKAQHQQYIHYNKGALAFYALRDYIGEEKLNGALSAFVKDKAFQQPPYTTSVELIEYLRKATPPDLQYLITDLFETITLYDLRTRDVKTHKLANGKWQVTFTVEAKKLRADGQGRETDVPLRGDRIDIGVFAASKSKDKKALGSALYMEKRTITQPTTTITVEVDSEPAKAGIDPYNKLIDRQPDDNVDSAASTTGA